MALSAGTRLGPYTITVPLGVGGMEWRGFMLKGERGSADALL